MVHPLGNLHGLLGMLERAVTSRFLRPVYIRELENLTSLAEARSSLATESPTAH